MVSKAIQLVSEDKNLKYIMQVHKGMLRMIFNIENNKIDSEKVNEYVEKRYPSVCFHEQNLSKAFEKNLILTSNLEISDFLSYVGYSKEGIAYYFDHGLELDIYYEVFTILSRSDLINFLSKEKLDE